MMISFTGGALFGLLAASLGLPPTLWAPSLLAMAGLLCLLTR